MGNKIYTLLAMNESYCMRSDSRCSNISELFPLPWLPWENMSYERKGLALLKVSESKKCKMGA